MASETRDKIDASWNVLHNALRDIPDDRATESGVCGEWSVKDLLAHIAYWDDRDVEKITARTQGTELEPIDWQKVNDEVSAERANWSLDQARQESEAAHERLLAAIANQPDLAAQALGEDPGEHYDEHSEQIRAWREQQGI